MSLASAAPQLGALASGLPLELARAPLCPEIRLWLLAPHVDLESACRELADTPAPPYWAFCWGAGQALAHYLLNHPEEVRGREVVDLGSGSGVVAIAAALAGAAQVTAVDLDPAALVAIRSNARENRVEIATAIELPLRWNLLLAADVLYEGSLRAELASLARTQRRLLIADPHRDPRQAPLGQALTTIDARTFPDVDPPVRRVTISSLGALDVGSSPAGATERGQGPVNR